ncbi:hypothetical protein JNUCC0626_40225 [Lentzea sp. JNUCC 0626]|uniref:hypothetical protein n=1 Tax=Lentzea sp. JNUCC 0626 TaxID=3367513 RepID=UPI003748EF38
MTTLKTRGLFGGLCYTEGCSATTAMGSSMYDAGNEKNRCDDCLDAINVLIPAIPRAVWELRLVDNEAHSKYIRSVVRLDRQTLESRAAPLLGRKRRAYQDFVRLARATKDAAVARDLVREIVEVPHLVIDSTITNFWADFYRSNGNSNH